MTKENTIEEKQQLPGPSPVLKQLDKLVGIWKISGGAEGVVTYEWMEGGHFLVQHVELEQNGMRIRGIEIIGHERKFGAEPSAHIQSRFYDNMGDTFDYVYELKDDVLTIWAGEVGSQAYYRGKFSDDDNTLLGSWMYPNGGGYQSIAKRRPR
jgi:hypothetical protein